MEYESDILKRLIKTYGVVGNPRYISEIIKEFIVQGKECYPNLFTYQADWLAHIDEFGLTPEYTVSYTGQSIYAPNTLERPVKSAILKGQTMVNVLTGETKEYSGDEVGYGFFIDFMTIQNLKANTAYTAIFKVETDAEQLMIGITSTSETWNSSPVAYVNGNNKILLTTTTEAAYSLRIRYNDATIKSLMVTNVMLIEGNYTNEDIPYFEGMQSVKIPVLTTSNEDGTKTNILTVNEDVELRGIGDVKDELNVMTGELTQRVDEIVLDGSENWKLVKSLTNSTMFGAVGLPITSTNGTCITDKINSTYSASVDNNNIYIESNEIYITILNANLQSIDTIGFKQWLQKNPITVQYKLIEKSLKTVDLTILDQNGQNVKQLMSFNGGTHFNTGSLEGSLLPSVSVSVETDLEETLKVCSLDGNTV